MRDDAAALVDAAVQQFDGMELRHGGDFDFQASAPGGIEAGTCERRFDLGAEAGELREEGVREEIERRGERIVRAAFQGQARGPIGEDQGRQDRLQHQRGAAGGADGEAVFASADFLGTEDQFARADLRSIGHRLADLRRGLHGGEMLAQQAGLLRPARMLMMRNGFPVTSESASEVRRICPPPSPAAPSMVMISGFFTRHLSASRRNP